MRGLYRNTSIESQAFDQLVLSGGGLRCFWQGGFLDVVRDVIDLRPARVAGVSGGSMSLAGFVTRRGRDMLDAMADLFGNTDSNVAWDTPEADGITPHQRLYREAVSRVLDAAAQRQVADGPPAQILIGRPPVETHPRASGTFAAAVYEAELHARGRPHFDWAQTLGVGRTLVDANQAAREGRLVDLICAAAAIPPVFDPPTWDGRPVIDGGMIDQAPMPDPDEGRTLILLTRHYNGLEEKPGRLYLEPREETPADKIDFTDPAKIRATWDAGEEDGRRFLKDNGFQ